MTHLTQIVGVIWPGCNGVAGVKQPMYTWCKFEALLSHFPEVVQPGTKEHTDCITNHWFLLYNLILIGIHLDNSGTLISYSVNTPVK